MKKCFGGILLLCLTILLTSCIEFEARENPEAIAEFSQYQSAGNAAVTADLEHIYFGTHTLHLGEIVPGEDVNGVAKLKEDKIVFSATKSVGFFDFTLRVYECDRYGKGLRLLFEKEGYKTSPLTCIVGDVIYIGYNTQHALSSSGKVIDSYNLVTGKYKNEDSGANASLRDYIYADVPKYECSVVKQSGDAPERQGDHFLIRNKETGETKTVDAAFLSQTVYANSIAKFNASPRRADVINNRIYITYDISGAEFAHLVFEYDFETETLHYELLAFPYDSEGVSIESVTE